MIIIWKAEYEGEDIWEDLKRLEEINKKIVDEIGGKIEGPYLPQDAGLLYIFHVDKFEWLNQAGRIWFDEVGKAGIKVIPASYEIAVTPVEFFGKPE
jgi:hypothetical protein